MWKKLLRRAPLVVLVVFALIQLVPYGRAHTNPPVRAEPAWPSDTVKSLARRACFDCHSNETRWPWYSHVAPVSWLVQRDVDEGRRHLNFSEWGLASSSEEAAEEAAEEAGEGEMPPWTYLPTHPEAKLSDAERQELSSGLRLLGGGGGRHRGRNGGDDD